MVALEKYRIGPVLLELHQDFDGADRVWAAIDDVAGLGDPEARLPGDRGEGSRDGVVSVQIWAVQDQVVTLQLGEVLLDLAEGVERGESYFLSKCFKTIRLATEPTASRFWCPTSSR